jgi:dTDP-4-dehydrorhamnose 3,5-epimerase-like enzyme
MIVKKIKPAFTDDRGDISDIFYKHPLDHVGVITSKAGVWRANHYHKQTTQHAYVTKGSLRYHYRMYDEPESATKSVVVNEGELVTTPPFEIHALEMLEDNIFFVFSEGLRGGDDYEKDTFRVTPALKSK